ncbi:hypothetical protein VNO77_19359 [Canavalia gladiata]|uniref:Uncharacterized protein n=1 Tax=Canavalia gladiata TaxID=3824 RepID=A0AAN9LMK2_CANGL
MWEETRINWWSNPHPHRTSVIWGIQRPLIQTYPSVQHDQSDLVSEIAHALKGTIRDFHPSQVSFSNQNKGLPWPPRQLMRESSSMDQPTKLSRVKDRGNGRPDLSSLCSMLCLDHPHMPSYRYQSNPNSNSGEVAGTRGERLERRIPVIGPTCCGIYAEFTLKCCQMIPDSSPSNNGGADRYLEDTAFSELQSSQTNISTSWLSSSTDRVLQGGLILGWFLQICGIFQEKDSGFPLEEGRFAGALHIGTSFGQSGQGGRDEETVAHGGPFQRRRKVASYNSLLQKRGLQRNHFEFHEEAFFSLGCIAIN